MTDQRRRRYILYFQLTANFPSWTSRVGPSASLFGKERSTFFTLNRSGATLAGPLFFPALPALTNASLSRLEKPGNEDDGIHVVVLPLVTLWAASNTIVLSRTTRSGVVLSPPAA